ncbi:histidine phosphatase superfamily [Lactarius pseudohatsudake]|nr:histidine phosphatase superfamily [Lactarius pseudohatsudake]
MPTFPVILTSFLLGAQLSLASPTVSRLRRWDISSYCNAPHRTPSTLVPDELEINNGVPWDCSGVNQFTYDGGGGRLSNAVTIPPGHPFREQIWTGSCEVGQLTPGGFQDSKTHGKDLWEVYHAQLGFLQAVQPSEISVRTTHVDRTKHVASGVLAGMDPSSAKRKWPAHAQPQLESNVVSAENSLVPNYKCPRADSLLSAAQAAPFWQDVLKRNSALKKRLDTVLGTESSTISLSYSLSTPNHQSAVVLYQDILTARTCNNHPLPCNAAGDCVSEEDAEEIFELGNFELDYLFHLAENATDVRARKRVNRGKGRRGVAVESSSNERAVRDLGGERGRRARLGSRVAATRMATRKGVKETTGPVKLTLAHAREKRRER